MKGKNIVIIVLLCFLFCIRVYASGGEKMEGSQLEQFEKNLSEQENVEEEVLFGSFEEMDYYLFLETVVGYGVSLDYTRYGIFGNSTGTRQEGDALYFQLNQKMLGIEMEPHTHREWADYPKEHIADVSPDLEWMISRKYVEIPGMKYTEIWYQNGEKIEKINGSRSKIMSQFITQRTDLGRFEALSEQKVQEIEQMLKKVYGSNFRKKFCLDEYGKLLAVSDFNEDGISVYSIAGEAPEELYHIPIPISEMNWPIEISQIAGNDEKGWIVYSCGDATYRMNYPDGNSEKIGEFMFATTYSPDGKYRAYCTGSSDLFYSWEGLDSKEKHSLYLEMRKRWDAVPPGWYVEELETGHKTYIPVEIWEDDVDRPLYGGRCVWVQKDKLLEILNS